MSEKVAYDYDYKEDSLFVYCIDPYEYDLSLELDNDVILDLDTEGKPVAFEFLNASKVFDLDKTCIKNLVKICIQSCITEESISIKVLLTVPAHNEKQEFAINRISSNLNNIPTIETELLTA